jgi:hypothetical protein
MVGAPLQPPPNTLCYEAPCAECGSWRRASNNGSEVCARCGLVLGPSEFDAGRAAGAGAPADDAVAQPPMQQPSEPEHAARLEKSVRRGYAAIALLAGAAGATRDLEFEARGTWMRMRRARRHVRDVEATACACLLAAGVGRCAGLSEALACQVSGVALSALRAARRRVAQAAPRVSPTPGLADLATTHLPRLLLPDSAATLHLARRAVAAFERHARSTPRPLTLAAAAALVAMAAAGLRVSAAGGGLEQRARVCAKNSALRSDSRSRRSRRLCRAALRCRAATHRHLMKRLSTRFAEHARVSECHFEAMPVALFSRGASDS